jgi:hypothetical protein
MENPTEHDRANKNDRSLEHDRPPEDDRASAMQGETAAESEAGIRRALSRHHLASSNQTLAAMIAVAAILFVAAAVGMAYVAGFDAIRARLVHPLWWWLVVSAGAEMLAFACYGLAYRGVSRVERGPQLHGKTLLAVIASGFGGFLAHGGGALDEYALKAEGAGEREASARVAAIGGLEHGGMPWIVCPTAIFLLIVGATEPPFDFTLPWAVIPPIGFGLGMWLGERYRDRLRGRPGWRGKLSVFLDGVHYVWLLFRHPLRNNGAVIGMILFWAFTFFSVWAGMAAFGFRMSAGPLIIACGVGYVLTQRTAPLGAAGILILALSPSLYYVGAPLAAAVLGVFVHRLFSLWMFMPAAVAGVPRLRAIGDATPA